MSEIISLINEKGGVGKSSSAISIAQILAISGYSILLIDLDPQMNTSKMLKTMNSCFVKSYRKNQKSLITSHRQIMKIFQYYVHQEY